MNPCEKLAESQQAALQHITNYAKSRKTNAQAEIRHVLEMSNIPISAFETAVQNIKTYARVALHFHPDRPDAEMKSVADAFLDSGLYKSQFETMLSSGSVSAFPGGQRDLWEEKIFGGAYHQEGVTNRHRPKYGALDLMLHPDGPSPRFGSCYFLLKPVWIVMPTYHAAHAQSSKSLPSIRKGAEKMRFGKLQKAMQLSVQGG
jgi:hypothetical protein